MHVQSCCFANPNLLHFCCSRCHRRRHLHQGQTEDFVIAWASRYTRQWQYGCDSAHQDCERCTFLGSFGRMLLREKFLRLKFSEMQSSAFWTLKFSKCLDSILNM